MRATSSVELFDHATTRFTLAPSLPAAIFGASITEVGGRFVVTGGMAGDLLQDGVSVLDPGSLAWNATVSLGVPRYLHGAAPVGAQHLLVTGGIATREQALVVTAATEIVDLESGACDGAAPLPFRSAEALVTPLGGGRVLVAGGYDDVMGCDAALFDVSTRAWSASHALPVPRGACSARVALDDRNLLFVGGYSSFDDRQARTALLLDLATLHFREIDFALPRHAAVIGLAGGRVLVSGGLDARGHPMAENTLVELVAG